MTLISNLRIQIAPVGFEIDRVVISAKKEKADRVWLIQHDNPATDLAKKHAEKIKSKLKKLDIDCKQKTVDRHNLFEIIRAIREIAEEEKGNSIYVNVASGSKIHAIACMMACMIFKNYELTPFYAEAKEYAGFEGEQQSTGVKEINALPTYEIQTPKPELISVLHLILEHNGKIRKKELAILAENANLITVNAENQSQARFASLDKNLIQPLSDQWGFVEVEKIGRNRWVKITEAGRNAAEFLV